MSNDKEFRPQASVYFLSLASEDPGSNYLLHRQLNIYRDRR